MGEKFFIISYSILILMMGCSKNEDSNNNYLLGTWVESKSKTDTIRFESKSDFLWLARGNELINGYDLPKIGSGPYSYIIENDSILLNPLLSSSAAYKSYYFNANDNNLVIGNFYDENQEMQRLTFIKLD